jgi:hypothetical protein
MVGECIQRDMNVCSLLKFKVLCDQVFGYVGSISQLPHQIVVFLYKRNPSGVGKDRWIEPCLSRLASGGSFAE